MDDNRKTRFVRPISVANPRLRANARAVPDPRLAADVRLTRPPGDAADGGTDAGSTLVFGPPRTVLGPTGRAVAQFWSGSDTQADDAAGGAEHWIYAVAGQPLTAERHLVLYGGELASWTTFTDGTARPKPVEEVTDARYAEVRLQPARLSDTANGDPAQQAQQQQQAPADAGGEPGVLVFEVRALGMFGELGELAGYLIQQHAGGAWLETRLWPGGSSLPPLANPQHLVLEPVDGVTDLGSFIALVRMMDAARMARGRVAMQVPEAKTPASDLDISIAFQIDSGSLDIIGDGSWLGLVQVTQSGGGQVGVPGPAVWTERWVVQDESALYNASTTLLTMLGAPPIGLARFADLVFSYYAPPEPDPVTGTFPVVNLPPLQGAIIDARTYQVHHNQHDGPSALAGHLYRQLELINGTERWRDHWVLEDDYQPPTLSSNVSLVQLPNTHPTRHDFLTEMHALRGGQPGWSYVEVAYVWQPFVPSLPMMPVIP